MPQFNGTSGSDFYFGGATTDYIYGYGGNDTLLGGGGSDYVDGGDGDDTIIDFDGQNPDTSIDTLIGGAGNDTIYAGYLDNVNGGSGTDALILRLDYATGPVTFDFTLLWAGATYTLGGSTIQGMEKLTWCVGSAYGDNFVSGTPAGQISELTGLGGGDTLTGGAGVDYLTAHWYLSSTTITSDTAYDVLSGLGGDDRLAGGLGDYFDGGSGTDRLDIDVGQSASGVTMDFTTLFYSGSDTVAGSYMAGIENVGAVYGSLYDDTITCWVDGTATALYGRAGNDTLQTGLGADVLDGGTGADSMAGGAGNDTYYVDNAADLTNEAPGGGIDQVIATASATLQAEVENLTLSGTGAINGTGNGLTNSMEGNSAANTLNGGAGDDLLSGLDGADVLIGGAGKDVLTGGAGADQFIFGAGEIAGNAWGTTDKINDFNHAAGDLIGLSGIDAIAGGADDAFTFIGSAAFTGVAGQLRAVNSGSYTTIFGDTNGDGVADFAIALNTGVNLLVGDFIL